jgi:hypothetical protein
MIPRKKHLQVNKFCALLIFFIASCNEASNQKIDKNNNPKPRQIIGQTKSITNPTTSEIEIIIDTFSTFPPEIDGCSCYFSNDSKEFKKHQYIFMNDYAEITFLKINGTLTKFKQGEFKQINKVTSISKAFNELYELTIQVKDGKQSGDEAWTKTGTIKLTHKKSGKTITRTFYGECGC